MNFVAVLVDLVSTVPWETAVVLAPAILAAEMSAEAVIDPWVAAEAPIGALAVVDLCLASKSTHVSENFVNPQASTTYRVFLVFNICSARWYLATEASDVAMEVLLIVDLSNHIAHASMLRAIWLIQRAHQKTIAKEKPFTEDSWP
jgi:hypothetical protein